MKFKYFKKMVEKSRDAWTEVLIVDAITTPLSYIIYKVCRSPLLPYILTIISFSVRIGAALAFYMVDIMVGALLFFSSILMDGLDGKLSRAIFGKDPKLRGLLDFLLDQIGLGFALMCLFMYFIQNNSLLHALLIFTLTILFYIQQACFSSQFRLRNELKIVNPLSIHFSNKDFVRYYVRIQEFFDKYRLMIHPTSIDAEFIIFVMAPFLKFHELLFWLALLFTLTDILILGFIPAFLLGRCEN